MLSKAVFAIACLVSTASHAAPIVIHYDTGGYVDQYRKQVVRYNNARRAIEIRGNCWSACTYYLAVKRVCVGPRAVMHFHAPYIHRNGENVTRPDLKAHAMQVYPAAVRRYITARGGLPLHGWISIRAKTLWKLGVRRCAKRPAVPVAFGRVDP